MHVRLTTMKDADDDLAYLALSASERISMMWPQALLKKR